MLGGENLSNRVQGFAQSCLLMIFKLFNEDLGGFAESGQAEEQCRDDGKRRFHSLVDQKVSSSEKFCELFILCGIWIEEEFLDILTAC